MNSKLRDEQAGFRGGRGTVEGIFVLRFISSSKLWNGSQPCKQRLWTLKRCLTVYIEKAFGK